MLRWGSVGTDSLKALEAGDLPGIASVIIDGEILVTKSRNTPPCNKYANYFLIL